MILRMKKELHPDWILSLPEPAIGIVSEFSKILVMIRGFSFKRAVIQSSSEF